MLLTRTANSRNPLEHVRMIFRVRSLAPFTTHVTARRVVETKSWDVIKTVLETLSRNVAIWNAAFVVRKQPANNNETTAVQVLISTNKQKRDIELCKTRRFISRRSLPLPIARPVRFPWVVRPHA